MKNKDFNYFCCHSYNIIRKKLNILKILKNVFKAIYKPIYFNIQELLIYYRYVILFYNTICDLFLSKTSSTYLINNKKKITINSNINA